MIKVGSDFSGVGAFNQALIRLGIDYEEVFACDMDKYARQTFCLNFGTENDLALSKLDMLGKTTISPKDYSFYFPKDVYDREIPKESLDIYMTSPPCQSFSLAGKRKGEDSKNGVLFYNSHEFIVKNNPRYFIFENVKGLLSDDNGKTFQRWIDYLGGKSVNGNPVIFPHENATPYHVYYHVMNAKHYGVPQNRERIFIIGIRDDADNDFKFPKPFHLVKRLKDVLESEVDEKYFLSHSALNHLVTHKEKHDEKGTGFGVELKDENDVASTLRANGALCPTDNHIKVSKEVRTEESKKTRKQTGTNNFRGKEIEFRPQDVSNTITTSLTNDHFIEITSQNEDIVILSNVYGGFGEESAREFTEYSPTIRTAKGGGHIPSVIIPANNSKGFDKAEEEEDSINFSNPNSETRRGRVGHGVSQTLDTACNQGIATRKPSKQELEKYEGIAVHPNSKKMEFDGFKDGNCPTILATDYKAPKCIQFNTQRIRRLTPRECFNLMDFNQEMIDKTIESKLISDSQLYKQAGNSICVGVLAAIIEKINL